MTTLDRVRDKSIKFTKSTGNSPKYLVVSIPTGLELLYNLADAKLHPHVKKPTELKDLDNAEIFGMKIVVLITNKEILEVG